MFDIKQFALAIKQIAEERGVNEQKVIETIEHAIAAAYKKDYGKKGQIIKAKLDIETSSLKIWQVKYVIEGVDEEGFVEGHFTKREEEKPEDKTGEEEIKIKYNIDKHITVEEVQEIDKDLKVGDELIIPLKEETDFGRIAAQTAKQVIIQRLREVERESITDEYRARIGEVISGIVQRIEGKNIYMDIGRVTGILPFQEQIDNDYYKIGSRLRILLLNVEDTNRGPAILLSRSHPDLVFKLFEFEVPEISAGTIEIKSIAREAGSRTKIAVVSLQEGVDPIGSLVGQRGIRVQTVINELSGEKIDIIEWNDDIKKFITNALSPAKILDVKILDEIKKHSLVEVADDQFSLAIGKRGQNVRLAAKLTGWKLDVRSPKEELKAGGVEIQDEEEVKKEKESEEDIKKEIKEENASETKQNNKQ